MIIVGFLLTTLDQAKQMKELDVHTLPSHKDDELDDAVTSSHVI